MTKNRSSEPAKAFALSSTTIRFASLVIVCLTILSRFRGGAAPGIGLGGMRERLAEFGGVIKVESSTDGSVIQAVIPTNASTDGGNPHLQ